MSKGYDIFVSSDSMTATLRVADGASVDANEIVGSLKALKLAKFDSAQVIEKLKTRKTELLEFSVASGTPAVDERPQKIDYRVPVADGVLGLVAKVEAKQIVATVTSAVAGTDGVDVYGVAVPHRRSAIEIGRNLLLTKTELTATIRGNLRLRGNHLSIEPLLEIAVDNLQIPPKFDGDAIVKGSLNEGSQLNVTGTLTVAGAIENVQLVTGGSVHAKGGLIGKHKGRYTIGGDLRCRYISGAAIVATGNIEVQSEIIHSRVECAGKLVVAHGPVCGGEVAANGGITCTTLGNTGGTLTIVQAGAGSAAKDFVQKQRDKIEANRKRVDDVRKKIEPLMRILKQLTPQQRERVTELLSEADELEMATEEMIASLETHQKALAANACAEVNVTDVVHPGVIIRFGDIETVTPSAFKGPLMLMPRKLGGVREIVLVEAGSDAATVLPSRPIERRAAA